MSPSERKNIAGADPYQVAWVPVSREEQNKENAGIFISNVLNVQKKISWKLPRCKWKRTFELDKPECKEIRFSF